jgi:hypothetical protein
VVGHKFGQQLGNGGGVGVGNDGRIACSHVKKGLVASKYGNQMERRS